MCVCVCVCIQGGSDSAIVGLTQSHTLEIYGSGLTVNFLDIFLRRFWNVRLAIEP